MNPEECPCGINRSVCDYHKEAPEPLGVLVSTSTEAPKTLRSGKRQLFRTIVSVTGKVLRIRIDDDEGGRT